MAGWWSIRVQERSSPASEFGDKTSGCPQTLRFLCVVYQIAIIS